MKHLLGRSDAWGVARNCGDGNQGARQDQRAEKVNTRKQRGGRRRSARAGLRGGTGVREKAAMGSGPESFTP